MGILEWMKFTNYPKKIVLRAWKDWFFIICMYKLPFSRTQVKILGINYTSHDLQPFSERNSGVFCKSFNLLHLIVHHFLFNKNRKPQTDLLQKTFWHSLDKLSTYNAPKFSIKNLSVVEIVHSTLQGFGFFKII